MKRSSELGTSSGRYKMGLLKNIILAVTLVGLLGAGVRNAQLRKQNSNLKGQLKKA